MIITAATSSPVITNITSAPSRFKIKASAKAFKILSGFYSEPILAIPRELGANAWDSHVKSGNTKTMFEVHAPNQLEPWFSVRDFGTGLSPEDVDQIYTTYFESTKTNENDSDGCMGLGSKTPFNYTDNFNVTSWFHGKKYVYNCFIDETGSPNIMHVATENSTEHNGLEVKFGVKLTDVTMWVDKINRAYAPFRNRPSIKGAVITYPTRNYLYQGKHWGYRKEEGYYSHGCNAFMGNYCYPVTVSALRTAIRASSDNYYALEHALERGKLDLFFEIGELEVAPNKEQLQYEDNNSTTVAIIAAATKAIEELKEMALKNVEVPKTRWEAMKLYTKYNSSSSEYYDLRNIIGDIAIMFNGVKVTANAESVLTVHNNTGIINSRSSTISHPFQLYVVDTLYGKIRRTGTYSNNHNRPVAFFYTNSETIKNARLRHHLSTQWAAGVPVCYIIVDTSPKAEYFQTHKDYFGWDKAGVSIIEIESLPKPPPAARVRKSATTDEIYYMSIASATNSRHGGDELRAHWYKKAETIDSTKTYYYMDFLWHGPALNGVNICSELVNDVLKVFVDAKLNEGEDVVYGINKKNKNLLKIGTWVNVATAVKNYVAKHKENFEHNMYIKTTYTSELSNLSDVIREWARNSTFTNKLTNPDTRQMFTSFSEAYTKVVNSKDYALGSNFYTTFGITPKRHADVSVDTVAVKKVVTGKYMGLFALADNYSDKGSTFAKLVNFIDENS